MQDQVLTCLCLYFYLSSFKQASAEKKHDCEESEVFKQHYFSIIENNQDLMKQNDKIYLNMKFDPSAYILGWDVEGRAGDIEGPIHERAGLVLSYIVKYKNREGSWVPIASPKDRRDVFINMGNLATPDFTNTVILSHPFKTKELRFFPELWDGSPYMAVRIRYCGGEAMETRDTSVYTKSVMIEDDDESSHASMKRQAREERNMIEDEPTDYDSDETEVNVGDIQIKKPEADSEECNSNVKWRYSGNTEVKDVFSSSSHSSDAYKAEYSEQDDPYLFSTQHKQQYIQIKFPAQSRLFAIKIMGKSGFSDWGGITQLSLLYQDVIGDWEYYTDSKGKKRMFDVGNYKRESALVPKEFHLPTPFDTRVLRLYPHKWVGQPYLSFDIKACYLDNPEPDFEQCSTSLLSKDGSLISIVFDDLPKEGNLDNFESYYSIEIEEEEDQVLVTGVKGRLGSNKVNGQNIVQSFVIQYLSPRLEWRNIVDDDGIVKIFEIPSKHHNDVPITFRFPTAVETGYLRLFPEKWTGLHPRLFLDVLGCNNE